MATASSVTQFGITWTFDTTYTVGTFANGDSWVLDPGAGVTITSTTPAFTTANGFDQHGMMANPTAGRGAAHGFGTTSSYNSALNELKLLPKTYAGGTSLITATGESSSGNRPQLVDGAVLTIVSSTPAAGDFRPPYCGTDKTLNWNTSDINYDKLHSLTPPNGGTNSPSSLTGYEGGFERPWFEINTEWTGRYIHPSNNQPDYGRDMARKYQLAILALQLDFTNLEKETLVIRLCQAGIDIYGCLTSGGYFNANGGHNQGRKGPMILAGHLLGDANIMAWADREQHNVFHEDLQTYIVAPSDYTGSHVHAGHEPSATYTSKGYNPAWVQEDHYGAVDTDGRRRLAHTAADIGTPEWGEKHSGLNSAINRDGKNWGRSYQRNNGANSIPIACAMNMMGLRSAWNWEPFFLYNDRYWEVEGPIRANLTDSIRLFEADMWDAYRYVAPPTYGNKQEAATADLAGGTYGTTQGLTFTEPAASTTYYTTDGSTPDNTDTEYTGSISIASTTTVKWITYDDTATLDPSEIGESLFIIACSTPSISPNGGLFNDIQTVTLATTTAGASIYYTLNGTDPSASSTLYAGTFQVGVDLEVQAIAIKGGLQDSSISTANFDLDFIQGTQDWENIPIGSETGSFYYRFTAVPESQGIDALWGLTENAVANPTENFDFDALATTVRFFTNDEIEVRNGGTYTNDVAITYLAGKAYAFEMIVDIAAKTYTVICTPAGEGPITIATDYSFRTEQAGITTIANIATWRDVDGDPDSENGNDAAYLKIFKVEPVTPIRGDKALIDTIL